MGGGEEGFDVACPFYDNDLVLIGELFGEVGLHEAGVLEPVEIVMGESEAVWGGVGFRNSETGAGDGGFDAEAFGKATSEGGFAGADITD